LRSMLSKRCYKTFFSFSLNVSINKLECLTLANIVKVGQIPTQVCTPDPVQIFKQC